MYFINSISRFTAPGRHLSLAPKGNSKFEMVKMKLVKMLSLKQETYKISPLPMEKKTYFVSSRKQPYVPSDHNF